MIMGQLETLTGSQIKSYLVHFFLQVHTVAFSWAKPAHFDFSSSNFTVQDHILSSEHLWRCSKGVMLELKK
jgi:hypothetical protein